MSTPTKVWLCILLAAAVVVLTRPAAHGLDKCKVKVNKAGVLQISAANVGANPRWGTTAAAVTASFFNQGTCLSDGKLKACTIGDPGSDAGKMLPAGCTLYLKDDGADPICAAFIKGCQPKLPDTGADGVVQINQARAAAGGVTPGDTPGFPVTISQAGSYRLTSNLDVTGEASPQDATAIEITSPRVSVDLNGFSIVGPVTGCPAACSTSGTGSGISSTADYSKVTSGNIQGMGANGADLAGDYSIVRGVTFTGNANRGLRADRGSTVEACRASSNGGAGMYFTAGGSVVIKSVASGNGLQGLNFSGGGGNVIKENSISSNESSGITLGAGAGSLVTANSMLSNTSLGLFSGSATDGYSNNVFAGNNGGDGNVQASGTDLGGNVCGNHACP